MIIDTTSFNMAKVRFKMQDGTNLMGELDLAECDTPYELLADDTMGALIPVYNVGVSGKVISTVFVNKDHVSMWWEVAENGK